MAAVSRSENVVYISEINRRQTESDDTAVCGGICYKDSDKECPQIKKSWSNPVVVTGVIVGFTSAFAVIFVSFIARDGAIKAARITAAATYAATAEAKKASFQNDAKTREIENICADLRQAIIDARDLKNLDVKIPRLQKISDDRRYTVCAQREGLPSIIEDALREQKKETMRLLPAVLPPGSKQEAVQIGQKEAGGKSDLPVTVAAVPLKSAYNLVQGVFYHLHPAQNHTTTYVVQSGSITVFVDGNPHMICNAGQDFRLYWRKVPDFIVLARTNGTSLATTLIEPGNKIRLSNQCRDPLQFEYESYRNIKL